LINISTVYDKKEDSYNLFIIKAICEYESYVIAKELFTGFWVHFILENSKRKPLPLSPGSFSGASFSSHTSKSWWRPDSSSLMKIEAEICMVFTKQN